LDFIGTNKFNKGNAVSASADNAVRKAAIQRTGKQNLHFGTRDAQKARLKKKSIKHGRWVHQRKRGDRKDNS
jgi:hypothetical protein